MSVFLAPSIRNELANIFKGNFGEATMYRLEELRRKCWRTEFANK